MTHTFFPYSWCVDETETEITRIRVYGIDDTNKNICICIDNFAPYVYIELPTDIHWTQSKAQLVGNKLDELCKYNKPLKKSFVFKRRLYYAHLNDDKKPKLFPYLLCEFSSTTDIRSLMYAIKRKIYVVSIGSIQLKMHEQNASPILQLICCRDIPSCGWVSFVGEEITGDAKETFCDKEYKVKWKTLSRVKRDYVGKPLIMGMDIEVNSSNPSAMPNASKNNDKIFQISCCFMREGMGINRKILLTLGRADNEAVGLDTEVREFDTECELLVGYAKLINETQPNVIVGYNIFCFDIPYMIDRAGAKTNAMWDFNQQSFRQNYHCVEKVIKWSSSAYKNQEFRYIDTEGRLIIDLLPLIKRDHKLSNYKLSTVAEHFIGSKKDPLGVKGIFKCYRIGMTKDVNGDYTSSGKKALGICGKYCVQDSNLVLMLMNKLNVWVGLCEMAQVCNVMPFTLYTQGQQIKVFSQIYKYCLTNNIVVEKDGYVTKSGEHFMGAYVFPPVKGLHERVIPFDFSSLYPSMIMAYNIDYSTLVLDKNVPDELCHVFEWEEHVFCEHDPKTIECVKITAQLDDIRTILKAERLARDKTKGLVKQSHIDTINALTLSTKPLMSQRSELVKGKPKHISCEKRYYRFLKEPKGVLPTILENLLGARVNTRDEIKLIKKRNNTDDIFLLEVLDKRQLAYKVSANSMYGAMGVVKGYLPLMPGAMCTTFAGRRSIDKASTVIRNVYKGELIYGDTDSNYISFPHLTTAKELWDYAEHVAKEVSKEFPPPVKLLFEETIYWKFLLITKKRYMYNSCNKEGLINHHVGKKGVLLARRDNSEFVRDIYEKVVVMVFNKRDLQDILSVILDELNLLCSGMITSHKKFIITKAVGGINIQENGRLSVDTSFINEKGVNKTKVGDYTVPLLTGDSRSTMLGKKKADTDDEFYTRSLPAQVQLAIRMRHRGQIVETGSRIEYVITTECGYKANQYEKIESAEYFARHKDVLKIDYLAYIKLLAKPLDQIVSLLYKEEDFTLKQYKIRLARSMALDQLKELTMSNVNYLYHAETYNDVGTVEPAATHSDAAHL